MAAYECIIYPCLILCHLVHKKQQHRITIFCVFKRTWNATAIFFLHIIFQIYLTVTDKLNEWNFLPHSWVQYSSLFLADVVVVAALIPFCCLGGECLSASSTLRLFSLCSGVRLDWSRLPAHYVLPFIEFIIGHQTVSIYLVHRRSRYDSIPSVEDNWQYLF